jgi:hypothetical protein
VGHHNLLGKSKISFITHWKLLVESLTKSLRSKDQQFGTIHYKLEEPRFWPHFRDYIGAIDGTHISVTVFTSEQPKYIGRHGYPS